MACRGDEQGIPAVDHTQLYGRAERSMSAAGPSQGANCAPAFGGSAAAAAASVGAVLCAAGPPQGANCAPSGGSAAAELANEAASAGVRHSALPGDAGRLQATAARL